MIKSSPSKRAMAHQQLTVVGVGVDRKTNVHHGLLDGGENRFKTGLRQLQGTGQLNTVFMADLGGNLGSSFGFESLNDADQKIGQ
jgi:hypothetical protein